MTTSEKPTGLDNVFEQTITIETTQDIVIARQKGRELAQQYAFSKSEQTRFATAISELTRNVLTYAVAGECLFAVTCASKKDTILARIIDNGPGIADLELALQDGYSGGTGLGLGLPGAKRLVHTFLVNSSPGLTMIDITICRQKR
jgi:serine/threonine-protein kinase RsbT|tara:strand:- start:1345 stop:1782 length:438 start_codon:yes stop_codon:yes gene_type:complete